MAVTESGLSLFKSGRLKAWALSNAGSAQLSYGAHIFADAEHEDNSYPSSVVRVHDKIIMSFDDLARFEISLTDQRLTIFDVQPDVTEATLTHLLNDHVAPRILAGNGELVLHGSAVEIAGKLAVFLGDTGAGKSTMAAMLNADGHRLLGDDAVIISQANDEFFGEPVYPSLRLFPETASTILGSAVEMTPMAHYSDKKQVGLPSMGNIAHKPIPVHALFFLFGDANSDRLDAQKLDPGELCISLIEQSFSLEPYDTKCAATRLQNASSLAEKVPGYELSYPHNFDRLPDVKAMILNCMGAAPDQAYSSG